MSEINLKLKTYDELTFEITRLNTDKYLLEQKLQQKENIIKEIVFFMLLIIKSGMEHIMEDIMDLQIEIEL